MPTEKTPASLTRREVAALSGAPLNAVDKAIEQGVVRTRKRGNRALLEPGEVPVVALLVEVRKAGVGLSVSVMKRVRSWVLAQERLKAGAGFSLGAVQICVPASVVEVKKQAELYASMKDRYIARDPEVLGGEPVIAGTRVPVRTIASLVEAGESPERIGQEFPNVPAQAYEAAVRWAAGNPKRGRPAQPGARGDGPPAPAREALA
jgi:uncharacterized protein (DUF433 family)